MPLYNLIECSDNYSKTSESLGQYYRDDSNNDITRSDHSNTRPKSQEKLLKRQRMLKQLCH